MKTKGMFFFKMFIFVLPFNYYRQVGCFGTNIFKKLIQINLERFDNFYQDQQRRNGPAVFYLRYKAFTYIGPGGQFLYGYIFFAAALFYTVAYLYNDIFFH